ncbi:hypothetical protein PG994_012553 [Apiospora phragmitis]|uniref:Uncharacterized protein n=1 Tax=Apiospora phragmitis TaxID=2905665 RepID=A0ABR1TYN3_9PEZI
MSLDPSHARAFELIRGVGVQFREVCPTTTTMKPAAFPWYYRDPGGPIDEDLHKLRKANRRKLLDSSGQWDYILAKCGIVVPHTKGRSLLEIWAARDRRTGGAGVLAPESEGRDRREPARWPAEVDVAFGFWLFSADAGEGAALQWPDLGLLMF